MSAEKLPDKYCPTCGSQWARNKILGSVPACQCSVVPVGTIYYNPVPLNRLQVEAFTSSWAKKSIELCNE